MEYPLAVVEHFSDSPELNVFCTASSYKVYGPYFFEEPTVTSMNYLDILQMWLMPQLQDENETSLFNKTELYLAIRVHLNTNRSGRWIGRTSSSLAYTVT
jgi:hypothetical protein